MFSVGSSLTNSYYSDIGRQEWRRVAGTVCGSHNAHQDLTVIVWTTTALTTARIISPLGMEVQDGQRRYRLNIFDKITALQHIYILIILSQIIWYDDKWTEYMILNTINR